MSRPLYAHLAAMRHQIRRIQRAMMLGLAALLPGAAVVLTTMETGWMAAVLSLVLVGYGSHKVRRVLWTRRAGKQLRLEEQFVRHGPTPEHVNLCTRRYRHLWQRSLVFKALQTLIEHAPSETLKAEARQEQIRRHFLSVFKTLRPTRLPADLVWFVAPVLLWLWHVPEAVLQDLSPLVFLGLSSLLLILLAEIVQGILCADLRDGFDHLATLLEGWTVAHAFDHLFDHNQDKPYRHTALYRSRFFAPKPGRRARSAQRS